jgi:nucleoid-associated protein YgaU
MTKHMFRYLIILALVGLLSSCAKPPHQEMDAAEYMVRRAQELHAMDFAPAEYQAAHTALNDARRAMDKADYGDARDSLEYALQHARRAVDLTEEGKTRLEQEEARQAAEAEQARQADLIRAREQKSVQAGIKKQPVEKTETAPKPQVERVDEYNVGEGETLWTISAQPQVYGEGLLWPLLYQANRDQIKDPRQIFPGQTLGIRRDMTSEEMEDARQKARESDIFPVPGATPPSQ